MEEITEAVQNITITSDNHKKNRIQVSNTKKPLFFYVNLAKRYMQQHNDVELSALGMAIATVVTIAEILKNSGYAVEKKIMTSTIDMKDESRGRPIQKAKIEILLGKTEKFDELMAAAEEERELANEAVQNITITSDNHKKNRIQVSNTKKPLFFYVNLAKRYMQQHNDVELSALGMAIATVVTIAEILKNSGYAVEKKIMTSTVDMKDESRGRPIQKAKIEILLGKTEKFDELMAAAEEERELANGEDQN
ncbi:hypothetical protein LXL04_028040 [Taraxacum kok-saghyz]